MEDSIYESISFRQEQEKLKERFSFQTQNQQKNYSLEDSILTKNLDYSMISQTSRIQQNQCANHQQNQQQARVNSINLLYQQEQHHKDIQFLDNNDILLMSPFQFSSSISKEITPSYQIGGKIDQNSQLFKQSQYSLQPKQFDDSTKKQFFTPSNKNNMKLGQNNRFLSEIYQPNDFQNMQDFLILIIYSFSTGSYKSKIPFLQNLDYIVFLKYLSIPQKVSEFENKLQISDSTKNWMKLIKLEIIVITLAHVACCIFLKIGLENIQHGQMSWIIKAGFSTESLWNLYLQSLYYMIVTICTIGYGDISPYQLNEKLYIAFLSVLATNVTAYAFSQISEIVKFESSKNQKFNHFMTDVNNQMKKIGLGMSLQVKVRKHFEFLYYQDEYKQQISESIVDKLPNSLKNEVLIDIYQEKINSIKMFKEFSSDCLKNILLSFKQKQLFPDEILLNQQENSENLYFLISGNLEINFQIRETKSGKTYEKSKQKIQKSDAFGYEGFLLGKCSQYTLKSIGPSLVSYIDRNIFLQILKQYPEDYEKFIFMRDSAIFGQKNEFFKFLKCISCGKFSHQISDCPYLSLNLTYKPSKEKNSRIQSFQRKRERQRNSLNNLIYFQEKAMAAYANNDESAIIDAYNICLKPISANDEKEIQSEFSSQSLNNSKNNDKAQSSPQIAEKQIIPFQSLSQKLPRLTSLQNKEQDKLVKELSIKIDESGQSDQTELKVNQNTLVYDQDKEKLSEFYQKSKETAIFNEESCCYRNSNRSILLTEEVYKDKLSNQDKLNQEKSNGIFNLGSSTIDKQYSSQQSGGQFKIQKINTLLIESSQNYFEEPEIYLLKQAFEKRKMRSLQQFNNFQRSLSDKVYNTKKSFNFNQNKQKIGLQDLDMLVVRKQFMLQQQQNKIQNFIQVPDNEIDIDRMYKNYQDKKQVLLQIKLKILKKQKIKQQHKNSSKSDI
ncbi:cyclic nucleotide-binding domain protein (macronuclear) [Tetrahymena thermophila SB210]|uniref:Cyclic nucleotide-binding domain protein n=1 Tax=Tetrahymena thermophila (strain SB210) TaxID=312017 RepID=Q22U35_TETTS|nr:cyclic nucleotide-binding domain protein [Tetrahymena thermophila SB210]EAR88852.2 cyclic nucleotide-binding domain protein [Tetrahymena thermophila SB210]|eukprot:XP_001009097.2 cyclic nucleotide-binding domain protein [Tetrahymena thermophila SB210]